MRAATDERLCQVHHTQMLLSGRFAVQMDDGEYVEIEPNEVFDVPPGHDAWVLGDERAVILDFLGNVDQLRPALEPWSHRDHPPHERHRRFDRYRKW